MDPEGAIPELRVDSDPVALYGCACQTPIVTVYECTKCERRRLVRDFAKLGVGLAVALATFWGGMQLVRLWR